MRPCLKHTNILYTWIHTHYTLPVYIYTHSHTLCTCTINTHIQCRYTVYTHCKHMLHTYVIHTDKHNYMCILYTHHIPTLQTWCTHSIYIICRHCIYTLHTYTYLPAQTHWSGGANKLLALGPWPWAIHSCRDPTWNILHISPVVWTPVFLLVLSGSWSLWE